MGSSLCHVWIGLERNAENVSLLSLIYIPYAEDCDRNVCFVLPCFVCIPVCSISCL